VVGGHREHRGPASQGHAPPRLTLGISPSVLVWPAVRFLLFGRRPTLRSRPRPSAGVESCSASVRRVGRSGPSCSHGL
jgi:hypothetical protein